jgi:NADH-quinone oxidoreductase subunit N
MNEFASQVPSLMQSIREGIPYFLPEVVLIMTFVCVIVTDLFFPGKKSIYTLIVGIAGILLSLVFAGYQFEAIGEPLLLFQGSLTLDRTAGIFKILFSGIVLVYALFIRGDTRLQDHVKGPGDLYLLLPGVLLGLNLMAMSSGLLMIYLSIEMISIVSYLMVGYVSDSPKQSEAAMKYALFGGVCSAIMLYGISLLYAFTGTLILSDPAFMNGLSEMPPAAVAIAVILVLVGIGFKLSFVPLHFWSPDVYEGAPLPVTAFLSTGPKLAGFAILLRFLDPYYAFQASSQTVVFDFMPVLSLIGISSMIAGNFAAVWQNNVKRMLAYSSIGHTGLLMMAVVVHSANGVKALLFYLMMYAIMNMAAFIFAAKIEEGTGAIHISDYKGLGKKFTLEMVCFVVILMSLTGLPPLAGFMGKVLIFTAAIEHYSATSSVWLLMLLIVAAITTVVSLFYYLKIPLNAFLRSSENVTGTAPRRDFLTYIAVFLTLLLLVWGIMPGMLI